MLVDFLSQKVPLKKCQRFFAGQNCTQPFAGVMWWCELPQKMSSIGSAVICIFDTDRQTNKPNVSIDYEMRQWDILNPIKPDSDVWFIDWLPGGGGGPWALLQ